LLKYTLYDSLSLTESVNVYKYIYIHTYIYCTVLPGVKMRPGRDSDPSPLLVPKSKIV